jgi:nucleoside-diphosphate-sugar epimerase
MTLKALVIGGTGPTGPAVVLGLLERKYRVTILHGGLHEAPDIPSTVRHIHVDPHFAGPLLDAVKGKHYDVVVAQYGRLRAIIDVFRGRTERLIAIGAVPSAMAAGLRSPAWGRIGRPALLTEDRVQREDNIESNKLAFRMSQAQDALMEAHAQGSYCATYLGYPTLYGPNQPGPRGWSVIRRALNGRRQLIVADGGMKLETRGYSRNVAQAVPLVIDKPAISAGKCYIVCDLHTYSMKQRIEFIAGVMGHDFELIDLPWHQAKPAHPLSGYSRDHRISDSRLIREELGGCPGSRRS